MSIQVRRNGSWVAGNVYVKRGGVWVEGQVYVRRSGAWVPAYEAQHIASGSVSGSGNNSTVARAPTFTSLGAQVGDLAVFMGTTGTFSSSAVTSPGGAWSSAGGQYVQYRKLTAGDFTGVGALGAPGGPYGYAIYRGASSLAFVVGDSGGGATRTMAGYAKHAAHVGMVATSRHHVPGSGGTPGLPTTPTTWISRRTFSNYDGNNNCRIADRLTPPNAVYVDNAGINWSTFFQSVAAEGDEIWIFELRA